MKPYPTYKPSGIDWLGEIPEHWEVKPLKHLLKSGKEGIRIGPFGSSLKSEFIRNQGYKVYGQEVVIKNDFELGYRYVDTQKFEELIDYQVHPGDLLITMMGTVGKSKVVPEGIEDGIIDSHLIRLKVDDSVFLPELLALLINDSNYILDNIQLLSKGSIMQGLNSTIIKSLLVIRPTIKEQTTIARFLDQKTAEIDHLIAQKQALIQKLEEEKQAIINQAVTKGLNPDASMKDSGLPWVGEIPEHWEVKKLKWCVIKIGSGITPKGGASIYQHSGVAFLRSQNIHFDGLRTSDLAYISEEIDERMSNSRVLGGDVLLNITGASIGRCYFVDDTLGRANVNQHVCIIRPIQEILETRFLYYFLRSSVGQNQIDVHQSGANREGLNFEQLKVFTLFTPSIKEQLRVVESLDKSLINKNQVVEKIRLEIRLIQEYKTALISEAVTGKIDVRNFDKI